MKKLFLIGLIAMLFIGCKKESKPSVLQPTTISKTLLIGQWHLQQNTFNTYTNGVLSNSQVSGDGSEILTLKSDNTGSDISPETNFSSNITYSLPSGNNISITYLNTSVKETQTGVVKVLTNNKLEIYFDYISVSGEAWDDVYSK